MQKMIQKWYVYIEFYNYIVRGSEQRNWTLIFAYGNKMSKEHFRMDKKCTF